MDEIYQLIFVLKRINLDKYINSDYDEKYEYIWEVMNNCFNKDIICRIKIKDVIYGLD